MSALALGCGYVQMDGKLSHAFSILQDIALLRERELERVRVRVREREREAIECLTVRLLSFDDETAMMKGLNVGNHE